MLQKVILTIFLSLKYVDLDREGLSEYKSYLARLGVSGGSSSLSSFSAGASNLVNESSTLVSKSILNLNNGELNAQVGSTSSSNNAAEFSDFGYGNAEQEQQFSADLTSGTCDLNANCS
jgi:hypothetical protein